MKCYFSNGFRILVGIRNGKLGFEYFPRSSNITEWKVIFHFQIFPHFGNIAEWQALFPILSGFYQQYGMECSFSNSFRILVRIRNGNLLSKTFRILVRIRNGMLFFKWFPHFSKNTEWKAAFRIFSVY